MGHARGGLGLRARARSRAERSPRASLLVDLLLEVRHVNSQLLDFREARGAAARRLICRVGVGLELLGDPGLGFGRRGGAGREEDHFCCLGCLTSSSRRVGSVRLRQRFEVVRGAVRARLRPMSGARGILWRLSVL